jgi:flagellar hook assembly protein FlgD
MKKYVFLIAVLVVLSFPSLSQDDSLLIVLKNGQTNVIPLSKLVKIQFVNITSVETQTDNSSTVSIKGNTPNPFDNTTDIMFELNRITDVEVTISNELGIPVLKATISNPNLGLNHFQWNGKTKDNEQLPSGIYYFSVKTNYDCKTSKLLLIR